LCFVLPGTLVLCTARHLVLLGTCVHRLVSVGSLLTRLCMYLEPAALCTAHGLTDRAPALALWPTCSCGLLLASTLRTAYTTLSAAAPRAAAGYQRTRASTSRCHARQAVRMPSSMPWVAGEMMTTLPVLRPLAVLQVVVAPCHDCAVGPCCGTPACTCWAPWR
jgi:hypothetical protein